MTSHMAFRHPFQKLCLIPSQDGQSQFLLAASGPVIDCISLTDGKLQYQWPPRQDESSDEDGVDQNGHRPPKRRKLDDNGQVSLSSQQSEASDESLEIVAERKKGERKKTKILDTKLPNVSLLLATSDGKHAIAVTAEDKAIRVFEIRSSGKLKQISSRTLPKKLCALRLTKDEKTILAADKFGDVYALPFHPSEGWVRREKSEVNNVYKPSATELTVHTKGNLEALRQQHEQTQRSARKEGPDFEHQIVLGHVSLLTDLVVAEGLVHGKHRPFILTSDRDEHIRVSRGIPQTHIIETFCLGHQDFVTRLCIPPQRPEILIAGNGEASLRVFDWQAGVLQHTIPILPWIGTQSKFEDEESIRSNEVLPEGRTTDMLAISGIWPINFAQVQVSTKPGEVVVLVAIEGMPLLLTLTLTPEGTTLGNTVELHGNVLDVAILESRHQILVSIDNVHKPYSMKAYRENDAQEASIQLFELQANNGLDGTGSLVWQPMDLQFEISELMSSLPEAPPVASEESHRSKGDENVFSNLGEFLYGLENLRKKRSAAAEEEAALDADEGDTLLMEDPGEEQ